jgi:hypothetical protein
MAETLQQLDMGTVEVELEATQEMVETEEDILA